MSSVMIEVSGLTKDYGNGRGCRDIHLTVGEGEAFGFLGPNGAGKSTFVKMLIGLIQPSSGQARIMGHIAGSVEARKHIGYLPELYRYQEWLSGKEVLMLHAKLCGMDAAAARGRINQLLDEVGLGVRGKDRVKHYSKGMQQRLGLACALIHDPQIVFLDEPSSALDPIGRMEVRQLLLKLRQQGKTIFLNSHLLEDVELLCDRVALLNNGTILQAGRVQEVLKQRTRWHFRVGGFEPFHLALLREEAGIQVQVVNAGEQEREDLVLLEAEVENEEQVAWFNSLLFEQGLSLYQVQPIKTRLDEWFVNQLSGLSHRGER